MTIHAPQIVYIVIFIINIIISAARDGQPKTGNHKFSIEFVGLLLGFGLLYWGGFFG